MRKIICGLTVLMFLLLAGCTHQRTADVVSIPQDCFFPEGIAAGPDGALYVGSLGQGVVVKAAPLADETESFIKAGDGLQSVTGVSADSKHGVLWLCSVDLGLPALTGSAPSIRAYSLQDGTLIKTFTLNTGSFPNHIAIADDGRVFVTDSFRPVIYQVSLVAGKCKQWLEDDRFGTLPPNPTELVHRVGLNGIAIGKDGKVYAVKTNTGEMYRITVKGDGSPEETEVISLPRPLYRPDGLETLTDGSFLVVEAASRVVHMVPTNSGFTMRTVKDGMDFPTTTVTLEKDVWVVESQIQRMKDPDTAKPFRVIRIKLDGH